MRRRGPQLVSGSGPIRRHRGEPAATARVVRQISVRTQVVYRILIAIPRPDRILKIQSKRALEVVPHGVVRRQLRDRRGLHGRRRRFQLLGLDLFFRLGLGRRRGLLVLGEHALG